MVELYPFNCPVVINFQDMTVPGLPLPEIIGLHNSGLSCDEDGEPITDIKDPEIPFGWHIIEADDPVMFFPELDL